MIIRSALDRDKKPMSAILAQFNLRSRSDRSSDAAYVSQHYIEHSDTVCCSVAEDSDGIVLGFQSLKRVQDGTPFGLPPGWGSIGTYVALNAVRQGIGTCVVRGLEKSSQTRRGDDDRRDNRRHQRTRLCLLRRFGVCDLPHDSRLCLQVL